LNVGLSLFRSKGLEPSDHLNCDLGYHLASAFTDQQEVRNKDYIDRLKDLKLWTLEERRNRADLIELFKM